MDSKSEIFNIIETIFSKIHKTPLNSEGLERLRTQCNKFVDASKQIADKAAIERCQKLNDATKEGFTKTSEALQAEYNERTEVDKALDERIKELENKMNIGFKNINETIKLSDPTRKIG